MGMFQRPRVGFPLTAIDVKGINDFFSTVMYKLTGNIDLGDMSPTTQSQIGSGVEANNTLNEIFDGVQIKGAYIKDLNADSITTGKIKANLLDAQQIRAAIINTQIINADSAIIGEGVITTAMIQDAQITTAKMDTAFITTLNANYAKIGELETNYARITTLETNYARITSLEADVGTINTLLAGNLTAENIQAGAIQAGSAIIATGAIGSSQISDLNAAKIQAGTLDTTKVTIAGANSRLKITGNRLQIFATKPDLSLYERIVLGDVNNDGAVYGLRVRGADGTTVLMDENGMTKEGFSDGYGKLDDNSLNASKLDIQSVVTKINGGTSTIQASKIYLDNSTLDVKFNTINTTVSSQGTSISSHTSQIGALEDEILLKLSSQTFEDYTADNDNAVSGLTTRMSTAESSITTLNNSIALKVNKTDIENYVQSRGENLVTNGTGLLGNNTNFTGFIFNALDNYGSAGSFTTDTYNSTKTIDELIPVNPDLTYRMTWYGKTNPYVGAKFYGMVLCFDSDKNTISPAHTMYKANTLTTLANDLKPGDTSVVLSDLTNWVDYDTVNGTVSTHLNSIIVWNYTNSGGYLYPPQTYSRNYFSNLWLLGNLNKTTKTITLRVPWTGSTISAGTSVSQGSSGGSYKYISGSNVIVPDNWTKYTGTISGIDNSGTNTSTKFHPATAFVKIGWLANREVTGSKLWLSNISFGIDNANQTDLDSAVSRISTAESSITTLNNSIALKVSQTDVNTSIAASKTLPDTRTTNEPPSWYWTNYPRQVISEFKQRTVLGVPGSATYGALTTTTPWTNSSGGSISQVYKSADGSYERVSTSTTEWSTWVKIEDITGSQAKVDNLNTTVILPLNTRVTSAESSITALNNSIALKVETSEFNSYKSSNDSAVSTAQSTANTAQSNLDTTNSNLSALTTRVNSAELKITDSAIVSTVRSSTAYTNDLSEKVSTNSIISTINQTAEEITISANKIGLLGATNIPDLTADKIKVGDFTNLFPYDETVYPGPNNVVTQGNYKYFKAGEVAYGQIELFRSPKIEFKLTDCYYIAAYGFKAVTTSFNFIIRYYYTDGTYSNAGMISVTLPVGTTEALTKASCEITAEPTLGKVVSYVKYFLQKGSDTTGYVCLRNIEVRKMYTGELIVNGSVTADAIYGGTLTLGGLNNTSGILKLKDSSNVDIVTMDNTGIVVNNATYRLKDSSNVEYVINNVSNYIKDGSFEFGKVDPSTYNSTYDDYDYSSTPGGLSLNLAWYIYGSPRIVNAFSQNTGDRGIKFGEWAIATTGTSYVNQYFSAKPSTTYTISGYASCHSKRNTVGSSITARMKFVVKNSANTTLSTFNKDVVLTSSYVAGSLNTNRVTYTFTTPANTAYIYIDLTSTSSTAWVVWDGIQAVEGSYPIQYTDNYDWKALRNGEFYYELLNADTTWTYTLEVNGDSTFYGSSTFFDTIDCTAAIHGGGSAGKAFRIGDDSALWDVDEANCCALRGEQNTVMAYMYFGNTKSVWFGTGNSQTLRMRGDSVEIINGATSGTYFLMNAEYTGSRGSEPSIVPAGTWVDTFGQFGNSGKRFFKMYATSFPTTSDKNLKENIQLYNELDGYDSFKQLKFYTYTYKDKNPYDYRLGTMAQDAPYIVADVGAKDWQDPYETTNIDLYSYSSLMGSVIQVLQRKIEELEDRLDILGG